MCSFLESINVQKSLTKQIAQTIEPKYIIIAVCNWITKTINSDIVTILAHIFQRYGIVEDNTLGEKEQKVWDI